MIFKDLFLLCGIAVVMLAINWKLALVSFIVLPLVLYASINFSRRARDIFRHMADAAWVCGDPGIQYDSTINDWNPVANTDRQHSTNPCSEFSFLNDTSCNLASLNLMKFVDADGEFDAEAFRYASRLTITAQEILVDNASYPTQEISYNSHLFRPIGLGYANLGALLMSRGLPYDDDAGRQYAAAITALMSSRMVTVLAPYLPWTRM